MLYGNRWWWAYVYGGDELYATIDVERKGLLVKLVLLESRKTESKHGRIKVWQKQRL